MKNWPTAARILFWFVLSILGFFVLRILLPESALFLAVIPGALFIGYMANLGVHQVRNPPDRETNRRKPED